MYKCILTQMCKNIKEFNLDLGCIELVDLMGYKKFIRYMQDSLFIISDSGTAQEEPALLGIPVIVPRDYTERPESIENNNSILLDLNNEENFSSMIEWAVKEKNMNILMKIMLIHIKPECIGENLLIFLIIFTEV